MRHLFLPYIQAYIKKFEERDFKAIEVLYQHLNISFLFTSALNTIQKDPKLIFALKAPMVFHLNTPVEIPNKLKYALRYERLKLYMEDRYDTATDMDAYIYLMSASLVVPLEPYYVNIYTHLFHKFHDYIGVDKSNIIPRVQLNDFELNLLSNLKHEIFNAQQKYMKGELKRNKKVEEGDTVQMTLLPFIQRSH